MADSAYPRPLILRDETILPLERVPITAGPEAAYNEEFICDLVFRYPQSLPISEIDRAYEGLVPVCKELSTGAGYLDALYATPNGRLVILEAKLWRNPESRRKVVAQVLDYAKELSSWSYERLQSEISKSVGRKGNVLYDLVAAAYPDAEEARFVDEVQQSLRRGRFMLLIVGDGIREGAGAITNFLSTVGTLEFTFGLVEVAIYQHSDVGFLVQPRVIARTVELQRIVIEIPEGARIGESGPTLEVEEPLSEVQLFYRTFWSKFLAELNLDDASQPLANITKSENVYFSMPPSGSKAWISAYFSKSKSCVGVYLRIANGNFGDTAYKRLVEQREEIEEELGRHCRWVEDRLSVAARKQLPDVFDLNERESIKQFFADNVNRFVNTFRPRLAEIADEVLR